MSVVSKTSQSKDKANQQNRLQVATRHSTRIQDTVVVHSNTEIAGTATLNIIPGTNIQIKEEPVDVENTNGAGPLNFFGRRNLIQIVPESSKFKLDLTINEKSGRNFNLLNTTGLPWKIPSTSTRSAENDQVVAPTEDAVPTVNENGGNSQELVETENNGSMVWENYDSDDDDCEIYEEICIATVGVETITEERFDSGLGNSHVKFNKVLFPLTKIVYGDPSTDSNTHEDMISASGSSQQEDRIIQYEIDKIPTASNILLHEGDSDSFLKITSHTCKTPKIVRCLQQKTIVEDDPPELGDPQANPILPSTSAHANDSEEENDPQDVNDRQSNLSNADNQATSDRYALTTEEPTTPIPKPPRVVYGCDECDTAPFPTKYKLRMHKLRCHGLCPTCPTKCYSEAEMVHHLMDAHNVDLAWNRGNTSNPEDEESRRPQSAQDSNVSSNETSHQNHNSRQVADLESDIIPNQNTQPHQNNLPGDIIHCDYSRLLFSDVHDPDRYTTKRLPKQFACTKCRRVYRTKGRFLLHLRTHTKVINTCVECQRDFEEVLTYHKSKSFYAGVMCIYCKSKTHHKIKKNELMRKIRTIKFRYFCSLCKLEYRSLSSLEGHMVFHLQPARVNLRTMQNV